MRESRHDNGGHQKDHLEADLQSSVPWSPPEESLPSHLTPVTTKRIWPLWRVRSERGSFIPSYLALDDEPGRARHWLQTSQVEAQSTSELSVPERTAQTMTDWSHRTSPEGSSSCSHWSEHVFHVWADNCVGPVPWHTSSLMFWWMLLISYFFLWALYWNP